MLTPRAIVAELDRMSRHPLWPGFDPTRVPVALYDGWRTWLFRHPDPPPEFAQKDPQTWVYEGKHPEVRANTSAEIRGVLTATLLLEGERSIREWAATLLHETFHVFQRERHPDWGADEAELFVYPVEDVDVLRTRRLETQALRRALAEPDAAGAADWAAAALQARRERFRRLPEGAVAYERGTELVEGLAQYVEALALGDRTPPLWEGEFPAEEVRRRAYSIGQALALLLDRFSPGWKAELEAGRARWLDELLQEALDRLSARPAPFSLQDQEDARTWAQEEVARLKRRRKALREEFFQQPGYRVILEAQGEPLWPQGFDPMNVHRLGAKEVLHTRWLKLGNEQGTLEVLNHKCLTEAAGEHPLFQGVRRAILTGFSSKPEVERNGDRTRLSAEGLKAEFRKARLRRTGNSILLELHE